MPGFSRLVHVWSIIKSWSLPLQSLPSPLSPHSLSLPFGRRHCLSRALVERCPPLSQSVHCAQSVPVHTWLPLHLPWQGTGRPARKCTFSVERKWILFVHLFFISLFMYKTKIYYTPAVSWALPGVGIWPWQNCPVPIEHPSVGALLRNEEHFELSHWLDFFIIHAPNLLLCTHT